MKKLVYISSEWMYDVDMGILNHMSEEYAVHWFFLNNEIAPRVKRSEVEQFANRYRIELYWKNNNIKQLSPLKFFYYCQIAKEIEQINPDVIIKEEQDFYWTLASRLFIRKDTIYMIHDVLVHSGTHNGKIRQLFTDFTIKANQYFVTFSESQKRELINRYGNKKKILSTHLSVKDFGTPTVDKPIIGDTVKLLFFGRIEYNKGLDILIKGLEQLYEEGVKSISLSIYGKGSYWQECNKHIKHPEKYNLQIRFIDNEEIPNLFASHHFLVLPYRDTTQSGPLMIAANYGVPLLAASHDSFKEIYKDDCSILYDDVIDGLKRVSTLSKDQYLCMLDKCQDLKIQFSGKAIASEILNYIRCIDFK